MRLLYVIGFTLLLLSGVALAQNELPADVRLESRAPARVAIGESLAVTLRLTSKTGNYQVLAVHSDRSGRVRDYGFTSTDVAGKTVRDPVLASALSSFGGGAVTHDTLTPDKPFEQTITANEWLAFDAPGKYFLRGWAAIVYKGKPFTGDPPIRFESEPVLIEVTGPDENSRRARLDKVEKQWAQADNKVRESLMRDLRFMLDNRAIPLLVRGFEDTYPNTHNQAHKGLIALLDKAAVEAELRRVLADENHFIPLSRAFAFQRLLQAIGAQTDYKQVKAQFAAKLARLPIEKAAPALVDAMTGSEVERTSTESWRTILRGAETISGQSRDTKDEMISLLRSDRVKDKLDKSLIPDLAAVAKNEMVSGDLRLSALATAHRLGYTGERDLVAEDVVLRAPRLLRRDGGYNLQVPEAQLVLGDYRAREIAEKLLFHALQPDTDFIPASRLRDFGQAATVEELNQVYMIVTETAAKKKWQPESVQRDYVLPLVIAMARKSPAAAIPIMRQFPVAALGIHSPRAQALSQLLARMTGLEAEAWRTEILGGENEVDLVELLSGFSNAIESVKEKRGPQYLPAQADIARRRFPEILKLFLNSPSRDVRASAHYCLTRITGTGRFGFDARLTLADDRSFVPKWNEWWEQNRAGLQR